MNNTHKAHTHKSDGLQSSRGGRSKTLALKRPALCQVSGINTRGRSLVSRDKTIFGIFFLNKNEKERKHKRNIAVSLLKTNSLDYLGIHCTIPVEIYFKTAISGV